MKTSRCRTAAVGRNIGEIVFKGESCSAAHPPILDRDLFEAVRRKLADQHNGRARKLF
jgi:hypothetical protein